MPAFLVVPLMLLWLTLLSPVPSWAKPPVLDSLVIDVDFPSGCGCSVGNKTDQILIASELDYETGDGKKVHHPAILKIAGQRHELKWVSSTQKVGPEKLGDIFSRIYEGHGIRLQLDFKVTRVCKPTEEDCEAHHYSVNGSLTKDRQTHRFNDWDGDCGC